MERTLEGIASRASDAGIFLDFDGSLSEIVRLPHDARPVQGAPEVLARLTEVMKVVAIVSGRSAHQLLDWLGPQVEIWGLHGAERTEDGLVVLSDEAQAFAPKMAAVLEAARSAVEGSGRGGVVVEDKGVVVGLHYRAANDRGATGRWVRSLADELASANGLTVAPGRMVLELRPPVEFSKRAVVEKRIAGASLRAAVFAGDDLVDLPAFDALDASEEVLDASLRIAVGSEESPQELIDRADVVVEGPSGLVELLEELVALAGRT